MKYIRTKDGHIYKIWKDTGVDGFIAEGEITTRNGEHIGSFKGFVPVGYDKVIAQADTIEELGDVVVVKYNYENLPKVVETMKNSKMQIINALKDNETVEWIKLGIYTDKGLIYVAKMNEKGELELL